MDDKKNRVLTIIAFSVLVIMLIGLTYAFFAPQNGGTTSSNAVVTSNTTDLLTFSINQNISFTVTQAGFASGAGNQYGEATATATLTPNNKTGSATMNYYLYLNIDSNPISYSEANTNGLPELMLQVFNSNNQLVTLTGLGEQQTIKGVTGYDITAIEGPITILDNHAISASNNTATIENWRIVITLINHDFNQNDNTGKEVTAEIVIREDEQTYCSTNQNLLPCRLDMTYNPNTSNSITLTGGYLYHHDSTLTNGANDGSYRYSGANPNNYICFGSDAQTCPDGNIYRIIGLIPVDVVTDSTTTPVTTERQMLYKIIKNDYVTAAELGLTSPGNVSKAAGTYNVPSGNLPSGNIPGFYWNGVSYGTNNIWGQSDLNNVNLNINYLSTFNITWSNKIANVIWKVGGMGVRSTTSTMNNTYNDEIVKSGVANGYSRDDEDSFYWPSEGQKEDAKKIGLYYLSDYGYGTLQSYWIKDVVHFSYGDGANNWLFRGVEEWSITRRADDDRMVQYRYYPVFFVGISGNITTSTKNANNNRGTFAAVRPTFYLTENTEIDMVNHLGTKSDPYRIL